MSLLIDVTIGGSIFGTVTRIVICRPVAVGVVVGAICQVVNIKSIKPLISGGHIPVFE